MTAQSSYNRPMSLSRTEKLPAATSARYFSAHNDAVGGKPVSEHQRLPHLQGTRGESWSGWHVAAASCLAAAATAFLIAYPHKAVQNEPSVDAATATTATTTAVPPLQRHSVGIVQRGQNRSSQIQYVATNEEDATTSFWEAMEVRDQTVTDGKSYDVSVSFSWKLAFCIGSGMIRVGLTLLLIFDMLQHRYRSAR